MPPKLGIEGEEEKNDGMSKKRKVCDKKDRKEDREKGGEGDKKEGSTSNSNDVTSKVAERQTEKRMKKKKRKIEGRSEEKENIIRRPLTIKEMLKRMNMEGREKRKEAVTTEGSTAIHSCSGQCSYLGQPINASHIISGKNRKSRAITS